MDILVILFVIVLCISFLCSILESILLSVTASYVSLLTDTDPINGRKLKYLKRHIDQSISSILILNTIVNTLGATAIGSQASIVFDGDSNLIFAVSVAFTFLVLFIAEIIPKTIGAVYWRKLTIPAIRLINFFVFITYPIIKITLFVTKKINKKDSNNNAITKEEIVHTAILSEEVNSMESDIIKNTLALKQKKIKDILTPRSVVFAVEQDTIIKDLLSDDQLYKFSRIPVYKESIDNVIGVALSKTIFKEAIKNDSSNIKSIMNQAEKINENLPVSKALSAFIKSKTHMAIVLDGYDQTEGIVTLEDCIETLLGLEIMDELDTTEDMRQLASSRMKKNRKNEEKNNKNEEK